ncbi:MAG: hypothetical protein HRF45_03570 [Fimbriimonadia bacterium]
MRWQIRLAVLGVSLVVLATAQDRASSPNTRGEGPVLSTLMLDTGPGSFRAEGEGTIVIDSFGGVATVFVSGLDGANKSIRVEGLRREYDDGSRVCFHGSGRVVVRGKFRAVNWMGNRMRGSYTGKGMIRLYGDLDKDLKTGLVWYPGFRDDKGKQIIENWETFGREFHVPMPKDYKPREAMGTPQLLDT